MSRCIAGAMSSRRKPWRPKWKLGQRSWVLQFDVADRTAAEQVLSKHLEQHGAFYGVVCNAGITRDNAFPAMSGDDWDSVINTNLSGFYNVLRPLRSEEHTSELQSRGHLVCRLLLETKNEKPEGL